jgi:flagellar motor switch/type III secretory pathway protein FliN
MASPVRTWLPSAAITPQALTEPLAAVLGAWRERWFSAKAVGILAIEPATETIPRPSEQVYRASGAHASATLDGRGKRHLLEGTLDVSLAKNLPNDNDHRLLDAFAASVLEDLVVGFDGLLTDVALESRRGDLVRIGIAAGSEEVLAVFVDEQNLVALLKASSATGRPRRETLSSRTDAMKSTSVAVDAMLGRAELSIEELENLSTGDVLILDRDISEKVDLCPIGQNLAIGRGRLQRSDDRVEIHF